MSQDDVKRRWCARAGRVAATVVLLGLTGTAMAAARAVEFPGPAPGPAAASLEQDRLTLRNSVISATWNLGGDRPGLVEVVDRISGAKLQGGGADLFVVSLGDGRLLKASTMRRVGKVSLEKVPPQPGAVRRSLRFGAWRAGVQLVSGDGGVRITWQATLRDQANAVRQRIAISAVQGELPVKEVTLLELAAPGAATAGSVDGSPVVAGNLFLACEHPMAQNRVESGRVTCRVPRYRPIGPGSTWAVTSAVGVAPPGQLRRAFLYYVDRGRARPYRPLFYYISWFDIAYNDRKMHERQCLEVIEAFGRELVAKRGAKLDAFVFDDGWDDNRSLWRFHEGFPRGFAPLQSAAARHGAFLGVWLSPWGGYAQAKKQRLEYGRTQGFETNEHGFSLGGPKYYARFRDACAEMIQKYGVRYLKFDGVGKGSSGDGPGKEYGPDIEAMLRLLSDLRRLRPELFVNATVGTWPSPYWLWYADTIWRGGGDLGYLGPGSTRQQWITYRDSLGYKIHASRGPLFPLNSLKFQSLIHAKLGIAKKLSSDPKDLLDDIHMAAGSGTQLQEFFVTSEMMSPELWDAVAEAVQWSRANADVLVDSHWVGGDPAKGEVYGFASWSPRKGILVLRNPAERPAHFDVNLKALFELPDGAPRRYLIQYPWRKPPGNLGKTVDATRSLAHVMAPFQVQVLEAIPVGDGRQQNRPGADLPESRR